MQIVEIQCMIFCHKAEEEAGLKFFKPAIKVENWQLEIEYFHNRITACKELVVLCPVLRRPKMIYTTATPTIVELNPVGIFFGNHTQQREPAHTIKHAREIKLQRQFRTHSALCPVFSHPHICFLRYLLQFVKISKKNFLLYLSTEFTELV